MSGFAGFSDADILNLQNGNSPKKLENVTPKLKPMQTNPTKKKAIVNKNQKHLNNKLSMVDNKSLPKEAKLSEDIKPAPPTPTEYETVKLEDIKEVSEEAVCDKKAIDLNEFQAKQKLMEEQNRRRKELLAKALADRTKRTIEEQQRLNEIQNELKKLDVNLSNDVSILRKQIEAASVEYMEAQKRYNRIEKEFLDAKLYLHQKYEKKEMLTEHLCAIIEKNEERKGNKLNELLQKLDVGEGENVQCENVSTSQAK